MYLINAIVLTHWTIEKTDKVITISDLSFITSTPSGGVSFAQVPHLIPPTPTSQGSIVYLFTPDVEGLWEIALVKGPAETYIELAKANFYVFDNETEIFPPGYGTGSLEILGM